IAYGAGGVPKEWIRNDGGQIIVGYDPFLTARKVVELRVLKDADGREDIHFVIPSKLVLADSDVSRLRFKRVQHKAMVLRHGSKFIEPSTERILTPFEIDVQVGDPDISAFSGHQAPKGVRVGKASGRGDEWIFTVRVAIAGATDLAKAKARC